MLVVTAFSCATVVDPGNPAEGTAIESGASDPVWDPRALPVFRLTLPDDWAAQLTALIPTEDEYCLDRQTIAGSLVYENPQSGDDESYEVTVRYRGHSALRGDNRYGFKLAFDDVDPDARFHDLKQVNLLGTEGDDTLLRERLAQSLMTTAGVPAPRVNHARLYINDEFQGIFPNAEEPDDQSFLDAHFDDASGHLYKIEGYCGGAADFEDKGDNPDRYDEQYTAKAGTLPEDAATDIIPFVQCVDGSTDAELATCLDTWTDLDEWITEMAVDAVLPDVDGLAGAGQNFLMYADPSTAKFIVYGWDKDQAFYTDSLVDSSIFSFQPSWNSPPELTLRIRTVWKTEFCGAVEGLLGDYEDLSSQSTELEEFLAPYIAGDPYLDETDWAYQVRTIRESIASHGPDVADQAAACSP